MIFLASLLSLLILMVALLLSFIFYVGKDMGFHYPLILILPMIALAGRIGGLSKWILAIIVGSGIILLDYYAATHTIAITIDNPLKSISPVGQLMFRVLNTSILAYSITWLAKYYFDVITAQQGLLITHATKDTLTGLNNRRKIFESIKQLEAERKRYNHFYSIMLCDLDQFKRINDNYGHDFGDEVLKHVSQIFTEQARESDTVSRWGGEEFLIILPNTDLSGARLLASRMCEIINQSPLHINGETIEISITIGVATLNDIESFDNIFKRADAALYRGKNSGRNQAVSEQFKP